MRRTAQSARFGNVFCPFCRDLSCIWGEQYLGCVRKELSFFRPHYRLDCADWQVTGDFFEWDYTIRHPDGAVVATVSKQLFRWTDTYAIDVANPQDALTVLMFVLAMDAEKCSRR